MKVKTDICWDGLHDMVKNLNRLEDREVRAGFDERIHEGSGLKTCTLAGYMEHGVRGETGMKIPPRPFLRQSADIWENSIEKESLAVVKHTLSGKESLVSKNLELIGEEGKEAIQASIELQNFTELSPTTIRIKEAKSSRYARDILLDSGELFQSATADIK